MRGIHDVILNHVKTRLIATMITAISDSTKVGEVKLGDLQGEPDPDTARISITLHENDPDSFISGSLTSLGGGWTDEVDLIEIGNGRGLTTWKRRFTAKARCLFESTKENLATARAIASTVRNRLELNLAAISFSGIVATDGEYVSRGIISSELKGEMFQSGGPPDSYDYFIKFRFEVLTTKT